MEIIMNFIEKLALSSHKNKSMVCVGLDPDPALMPPGIGVLDFNRAIIEATSDLVCAYKPNLAFYEALGSEGMVALKETVKLVPQPIPVIGDAKRSDIGNTAKAYARAMFDYLGFDASTVNPLLGHDAVQPFLDYKDKGIIILCRTSNPGAVDFQSLRCETPNGMQQLFEIIAQKAQEWNKSGNVGLVVGATYPEELKMIREKYPEMPLLIPGVGAQGGDLELTVSFGADTHRERTAINSSRQILYASRGKDFADAARGAAQKMRDEINKVLDRAEV
jgi:orotidine-5'-phosphate decarboxylase